VIVRSLPSPHIVVDARMATDGGIGTYLQGILPRIAASRPAWTFTLLGDPAEMRALGWDQLPNVRLSECHAPIFSVQEQLALPRCCPRDADLYWAPHYNIPLLMRGRPFVVTIHDVCHLALPELMGGALRSGYARWLLKAARGRARRVLFDSEFTRRETVRLLGAGENGIKGTVAHLAADEEWTHAREQAPTRPLPEKYFLYVGNIKRHKNVPLLLRAFGNVRDRIPHRLVLIGRREGLRVDPGVAAEAARLGERVLFLGEVSKGLVRRYVAHAEALVTASLYEGFGLPPLEAMAAGCPCIVSSAGSLPEVCGDAALYCDPSDESSVSARLLEIATAPHVREQLIARGRRRAAQFSWQASAATTAAALEGALASVGALPSAAR
jgi:glycosyltransferase involved in cell wall biosynthesis